MTIPDSSGVEERGGPVPEPDEDVLWRGLGLASVVVVGIDGDVDAALAVGQSREPSTFLSSSSHGPIVVSGRRSASTPRPMRRNDH